MVSRYSKEVEKDGGVSEYCCWVNHLGLGLIMHPHLEMPELEEPQNRSPGRPQDAF